jgi:hypothetical protein
MGNTDQEKAETEELLELPPSLENIDAKLNYTVTHVMLTERICNRALAAAERAEKVSIEAKAAAMNAADTALRTLQSREPLSRKERFSTVFAGAAAGGAFATIVLTLLGISSAAVAITSCGAH